MEHQEEQKLNLQDLRLNQNREIDLGQNLYWTDEVKIKIQGVSSQSVQINQDKLYSLSVSNI